MADTTTTEEKPAGAELVTPSDIVTPLGDRMPEATEAKEPAPIPGATAPTPPPSVSTDPNAGKTDARGFVWNSKRFQINPDGTPRLNKNGYFMYTAEYKGRGAKKPAQVPFAGRSESEGNNGIPEFNEPGSENRPVDPNIPGVAADEYDLAAEVYLQSFYGPIIIAFSEHARPEREEHIALKGSLANLLRVKQVKEPSPGWAFALVAVAIAVKKSAHPEIQKRASTWGERIKIWFGGKKFKAPQIQTDSQ